MNFTKKLVNHTSSDEDLSYMGSNGSFVNSEDDYEYQPTKKRLRTNAKSNVYDRSNNNIQRRPTRVPNMKIQNRNALLARENRKRKKEIMETLEKKVEVLHEQNKKLQKMMKLKDSTTLKLEQEVRYLKSVIKNKTEIVSVLKSLPKFSTKPFEMKQEKCVKDEMKSLDSGASSETASCNAYEDNDLEIATEWDEILANPFSSATNFTDIPKLDEICILSPASSPTSGISTEHNYFEKQTASLMESDSGAGVCVHINSGRVSLEFCSTCHYNATNAWVERN